MHLRHVLCLGLAVAMLPLAAAAQNAGGEDLNKQYTATIERLMPGMGAEKMEDRQAPQQELEKLCHEVGTPGREAERTTLSKAIMSFAVKDDASKIARIWLLRKMESLGRDEAVEPLAGLLKNADQDVRETARRCLQANPAPAATKPLADALAAAQDDASKIAFINALAFRGPEAVSSYAQLANSGSESVALAAIAAMGQAGGADGLGKLTELWDKAAEARKAMLADAIVRAAEKVAATGGKDQAAAAYEQLDAEGQPETIRMAVIVGLAATRGEAAIPTLVAHMEGPDAHLAISAARVMQTLPPGAVAKAINAKIGAMKPENQVLALETLGRVGNAKDVAGVAKLLNSPDTEVRVAAAGALRYIGDENAIEPLAKMAAGQGGPEKDAAREALKRMGGAAVDKAVLKAIGTAQGQVRSEMVRAAAVRLIPQSVDVLITSVNDPDESVRVPVIYNLGKLIPTKFAVLALVLGDVQGDEPRRVAEEALTNSLNVVPDAERVATVKKAMAAMKPAGQAMVIRVLGKVRGAGALDLLNESANSQDPAIKAAGEEGVRNWPVEHVIRWVFAGPYSAGDKLPRDAMNVEFDPEKADAKVEWNPLPEQGDKDYDLQKVPAIGTKENLVVYVQTTITVPKPVDIQLQTGSDDGLKAWINGKVVHEANTVRGLQCSQDTAKARLKKGKNVLMLKLTQGGGQFAFCCKIRGARGGALSEMKVEAK